MRCDAGRAASARRAARRRPGRLDPWAIIACAIPFPATPHRLTGRTRPKALGILLVLALVIGGVGVSSYDGLVSADEQVDASWSEIQNQYKRRFDLVPQLVVTVKGAADFEKSTITEVTAARARVGSIQLPAGGPESQAQLDEYLKAQEALGTGLSRLLAVSENYPQLRATEAFRDLQSQLEGNENRITVARRAYVDAVKSFNTSVRSFPKNLLAGMFGFETKPQLEFDAEVETTPTIDFGTER